MVKPMLTNTELEIMQVVWDLGEASVRDVHEILQNHKQVAYTTVMTMMKILEEKGHLIKAKQGRAFIYCPVRPKQQVVSTMLNDFLNRVYEGSAGDLVLNLIKDKKLSKQELQKISKIIKETK